MKRAKTKLAIGGGALAALAGVAWIGLQIEPAPFPPVSEPVPSLEYVPLPDDLPVPVARFYQTIAGDQVPVVRTAVISGRATLRFAGITFPARFRFTYEAGRNYHHNIEATFFGLPILKADESYIDGAARMVLPFGVTENEPKVDMAANLGLWGEGIWMPSILVTDPRVRWKAMPGSDGETMARLVVPFGEQDDSFVVAFDPQTGLMTEAIAERFREADDTEKIPWRLAPHGWQTFNGIQIPTPASVTWMDEDKPWAVFRLEELLYNVPVSPPL